MPEIKPVPPREYAAEQIQGYILEHHLEPGDRLPSERDMCEMWGINRSTLRSAIQRLSAFGLLDCRIGSGTYIAHRKLIRNLQDTIGFSEFIRQKGQTTTSSLVFARIVDADKYIMKRLHLILGSPIFSLCRVRRIDNIPVSIETTSVNYSICNGIERHDFTTESLFDILREEYKIIPGDGHEKLSITSVEDTEAQLLGCKPGQAAYLQSGIITTADGTPIEYFKNVVLPEYIRFASELRDGDCCDEESN